MQGRRKRLRARLSDPASSTAQPGESRSAVYLYNAVTCGERPLGASAAARPEAFWQLDQHIRMRGRALCYGRLCPGSGMPLSRRMRLAVREWLWRIQIATSRIRSKLTTRVRSHNYRSSDSARLLPGRWLSVMTRRSGNSDTKAVSIPRTFSRQDERAASRNDPASHALASGASLSARTASAASIPTTTLPAAIATARGDLLRPAALTTGSSQP
jgi:hypothetical protein